MRFGTTIGICALLSLGFAADVALAGENGTIEGESRSITQLKLNSVETIRLDADAATVMLANPEVAGITMDNPRFFFLRGIAAGTSTLDFYDKNSNRISSTMIVVKPDDTGQVNIERVDTGGTGTLSETLNCIGRCVSLHSEEAAAAEATAAVPAVPAL